MAEQINLSGHLGTKEARSMAEISQSHLQLTGVSSLWLTKLLPWVDVTSGVYQVNRAIYDSVSNQNIAVSVGSSSDDEPVLTSTAPRHDIVTEAPRQYNLRAAQTILKMNTKAIDLYNEPYDQTSEQIGLTVKSLREVREDRMINDKEFGLLHTKEHYKVTSANGLPTPLAVDKLISKQRNTHFLLAHPKTIAAFGHQCNERGLVIQSIPFGDYMVPSWRGIPLLNCRYIPIDEQRGTSSILALRTGENNEGVIGLRPKSLPDQFEPGVNIRFMGIDDSANISYLISSYFSVAVLIPSALGILGDLDIEHLDPLCD